MVEDILGMTNKKNKCERREPRQKRRESEGIKLDKDQQTWGP